MLTLAERVGLRTLHNLGSIAVNGVYARDIPQSLIRQGLVSNDGVTLLLTEHGRQVAHALSLEDAHEAS